MKSILEILSHPERADMTGNRLWMDELEPEPGFAAKGISYITHNSVSSLAEQAYLWKASFRVDGREPEGVCRSCAWTPAGMSLEYTFGPILVKEKKYIDRRDRFVSILSFSHALDRTVELEVTIRTILHVLEASSRAQHNPNFIRYDNRRTDGIKTKLLLDLSARFVIRTTQWTSLAIRAEGFAVSEDNASLKRKMTLLPGNTATFIVVGMMDHTVTDLRDDLMQERLTPGVDLYEDADREVKAWFEKEVPAFRCSDPKISKMYAYRWYVVYKNLITPHLDCFQYPCFYEGKDRFSLVCTASTSHQLREARWLRSSEYVHGHIRNLMASQLMEGTDAGRFRDTYINDIPHAIWEAYLVYGDEQLFKPYSQALEAFVRWESSDRFCKDRDGLPVVTGSWRTAMEYQPGFYEFTSPSWDHTLSAPFLKENEVALKRVDEAVYLYLNLLAIANMMIRLGRQEESEAFIRLADETKEAILMKMWDPGTRFFYDLDPVTHRKAMQSKSVTGFFPTLFGLQANSGIFDHLGNPDEFHSAYPIVSVAKDCPAYDPHNRWTQGPHASLDHPYEYPCCWNGPSWNFTNAIVIDALGDTIQRHGAPYADLFRYLFVQWTEAQYENGDIEKPNTCEHFHPDTGKQYRDVKDYFHSYYNDVLIRRVVGLMPEDSDTLTISPIDMGWSYWVIENVAYRNHQISIAWNAAFVTEKEVINGLRIMIDGRLVAHSATLERLSIPLSSSQTQYITR